MYYVPWMRLQGHTSAAVLHSPDKSSFSRLALSLLCNLVSGAFGHLGIGINSGAGAVYTLLNWISLTCRLCALRLHSSFCAKSSQLERRCVFIVHVNTSASKVSLYREFSKVLRRVCSADVVIVPGDFDTHLECLGRQRSIALPFPMSAGRTNGGDRPIQICSYHNLFRLTHSFPK